MREILKRISLLLGGAMAFLVTLSIGNTPVLAQDKPQSLSLEQAIELGLKRSEDVQVAAQELLVADARIREAWGGALPQVSANIGANRYFEAPVIQTTQPNGSVTKIPIKKDWEVTASLEVKQVIWAFGRVGNGLDLAKVYKQLNEYGLDAAKRELRLQVTMAYYSVQTQKQILKAAEESLTNAESNKRSLESRFQGGRAPRFDNIKMASDIASRKPAVVDAKKAVDLAYLQLALLLNLDESAQPELTTSLDDNFKSYSLNALMDQAQSSDVALKATRAQIDLAQAQKRLARSERLPILAATGGVQRVGTGDSLDIPSDNYNTTTFAGVALVIPIWNGGSNIAKQRQAEVEVTKAEIKLRKYNQDLRLQLESALSAYRADVEKYKLAKEAAGFARERYLLTRTSFGSGGVTQKELNDVEIGLYGSKVQIQATLLSIHQSLAQIQRIVEEVNQI